MVCRHLPLCHFKHVEYHDVVPPLGPQNATSPQTSPSEIAESNVHLQTNAHSLPQSPQPISPSYLSGDHTHCNIRYLEQLLDSSLATVAVIQFSGNTLAEVLTPRAYDTFKALYQALYALAAFDSDAAASSTKPKGSVIPNRSNLSDIGDDCPYLSNRSHPMPNSSTYCGSSHW